MRVWISIFVIAFTVLTASTAYSQSVEYVCADLTSALDLTTLCEEFATCDDTDVACLQEGVASLLSVCTSARLSNCDARSALYWIVNHHIQNDGLYLFHPDGFESSLLASVSAFDNEDYESAILEFEDLLLSEDYAPYFTLNLLRGILYYSYGELEIALSHFDASINAMPEPSSKMLSEFDNPLAYYFRGRIYLELGDESRALQDFYTYDALANEGLKARLPLSTFRLMLNNPQPYVMYPVFNGLAHLYGFGYADLSLSDPQVFQLDFRNDDDTLVVLGLFERPTGETPEMLFLERDPDNPSDYYLDFNTSDLHTKTHTYHLKITVHPTHLNYYETRWHSDGTATRVGIILPNTAQDIRTITFRRICEGAGLSFIQVDDVVTITDVSGEISLVDDPLLRDEFVTLNWEDFEETPYTVIEGPVCFEAATWWRISNGTYTGWLTETDVWSETFFWDDLASPYHIMPQGLVEAWINDNSGLYGIPTPLEFLGEE